MEKLRRSDIKDIIAYEKERVPLRREIVALKKLRRVFVGPLITVVFENRDTVRFQIQEMMRAERIVEEEGIAHEIETYNELIPGSGELSATLFVELDDSSRIRGVLNDLIGVNEKVFLEIGGERVQAIFQPGTYREDRLSAVHYVKFRLTPERIRAFRESPEPVALLIDHPNYMERALLSEESRRVLGQELAEG
ncbi:MAG: DUF3501 family protein [Candidatus Tectomicrobia bacterium]|uniref:DUF3501 family protein n=1 Tax=Tectimicrobiota bacterium TaxID=2528274 RepID=A0A932GQA4_UNCTE|nr:DUF3501 family protein [Candidatus Tectomicrobia bacterium]